ncbi:hypothetical protein T265_11822 [Opisthorchis viverrini]|uniref:Peptidase C13 family protein n=1 Tax=Opisthorchis viverrini TaxID=6198 RepID=A0A074YX60_OPIVI|nr:hypothetical protein T265_11822 [Opisthorchis viverrini]KER19391.1 hypothetical protein T265_11822 [Opisthorchis viverrini]
MKLQVNLNMMPRASLLFEFLYCINHLAWLGAVDVHNWSSIFNNNPSKNWVVLVAGTNTWRNYRHQADVYHAYQVVRKNNVPAENIITFAYDDIANNPKNPFKGKVFHDYMHEDIYQGVEIDYRGKLHAVELNEILAHMHSKKKYNKLVLYVEACYSGSLFRNMLPPNVGIYVTTASKEDEKSWSIFCDDKDFDMCLAGEYAYAWIKDSEYHDLKTRTLQQQYEEVRKRTANSHVMQYGEMGIGSLPVGKFQGHYDLPIHRYDGTIPLSAADRQSSLQAHLFSKSRRLMEATTEQEHEAAWRKLHRASQLGRIVKETFRDIVGEVMTHHKPTLKGLSKRDKLMCFQAVFDQLRTHCFTIQQVPEVAQHTTHLIALCKAGYMAETLIDSVYNICS